MEKIKSELISEITIKGVILQIDGYYTNSRPNDYEWYDVFHQGVCVNEGEPFYEYPTEEQLIQISTKIKKEYSRGLWKSHEMNEVFR